MSRIGRGGVKISCQGEEVQGARCKVQGTGCKVQVTACMAIRVSPAIDFKKFAVVIMF